MNHPNDINPLDIPPYPGAVRARNMVVTPSVGPMPTAMEEETFPMAPVHGEAVLSFCDGRATLYDAVRWVEESLDFRFSREEFGKLVDYVRWLEFRGAVAVAPKYPTTPEQLREALIRLGITPGMRLLMHSSYASLGAMRGGPEAVLEMLMGLLTPDGTLMLPTFNFYKFNEDGVYDPRDTPSQVGVLTNVFRAMRGVHRSYHPTHSFAAWGKDAERYVQDHHLVDTMGEGSPMDLMAKDGGWILLIDCPTTVTYMHFVETVRLHAKCVHPAGEEYPVRFGDGSVRPVKTWSWRNGYCTASNLLETWKLMRQKGWLREMPFANGNLKFFQFQTFEQCHAEVLGRPENCGACPHRPRLVPQTLPELKPLFEKYNRK